MARTTTTAAGTKRASARGASSAGSQTASTPYIKRSLTPLPRGSELWELSSINTLVQKLIATLRQQHKEITRGIFVVRCDPGEVTVHLTKSEQEMLRSFYSGVLKEARQLSRTEKLRASRRSTTSGCEPEIV